MQRNNTTEKRTLGAWLLDTASDEGGRLMRTQEIKATGFRIAAE